MIISIDTGKAFDKTQHAFTIKVENIGLEGLDNTTKTIYKKLTANITLNVEKLEALPLK